MAREHKKSMVFGVRISTSELEILKKAASKAKMSLANYARLALKQPIDNTSTTPQIGVTVSCGGSPYGSMKTWSDAKYRVTELTVSCGG